MMDILPQGADVEAIGPSDLRAAVAETLLAAGRQICLKANTHAGSGGISLCGCRCAESKGAAVLTQYQAAGINRELLLVDAINMYI